jgi:hypothetical protein
MQTVKYKKGKPGGLDLSRRGLDRDSRSRHQKKSKSQQFQKPCLNNREISINLDKSRKSRWS